MQPGRLRHRVTIERCTNVQDPVTLEITPVWSVFATGVPADPNALRGREFIAAQAEQSGLTTQIEIRYLEGVVPQMRVRHLDVVHNILAVIPDRTYRRSMQLMCESGVPSPPIADSIGAGNTITTEGGDQLVTESGDHLVTES